MVDGTVVTDDRENADLLYFYYHEKGRKMVKRDLMPKKKGGQSENM